MPLTRRLARRYVRGTEPIDDLLQVASIGLVNAIDRFDVTRGRPFTAFAVPTILGEMRRYFRDSGWALHVPRTAKERALEVRDAAAELHASDGRSPTAKQLAEYLELEIDEVLDAMAAMDAHQTSSLDAPRPSEDGAGRQLCRQPRRGGRTVRPDRVRRDAVRSARRAEAARSRDPADALRGGAHASRDREPHRGLADARVETAAEVGGEAAAPHACAGRNAVGRPRCQLALFDADRRSAGPTRRRIARKRPRCQGQLRSA